MFVETATSCKRIGRKPEEIASERWAGPWRFAGAAALAVELEPGEAGGRAALAARGEHEGGVSDMMGRTLIGRAAPHARCGIGDPRPRQESPRLGACSGVPAARKDGARKGRSTQKQTCDHPPPAPVQRAESLTL